MVLDHRYRARGTWRDFFEVLVVALLLALFARTWVLQAFRVPSTSMAPGLLAGDLIVVNKFVFQQAPALLLPARAVRHGDVVVFRLPADPEQVAIKRSVAIGGDQLRLVDKQLLINGEETGEPFVVHHDPYIYPRSRFLEASLRTRDNMGPLRVPDGHLFLLGDNRDESQDSRVFGSAPTSSVVGRAVVVAWSQRLDRPHLHRGSTLARSRGGRLLKRVSGYFSSFRPGRLFRVIR